MFLDRQRIVIDGELHRNNIVTDGEQLFLSYEIACTRHSVKMFPILFIDDACNPLTAAVPSQLRRQDITGQLWVKFFCVHLWVSHLFPRFPAETLGKSDMSGKSRDITGHSGQLGGVEVCLCTCVGGWPLLTCISAELRLLARLVGVAKDKICSQLVEASWVLLGTFGWMLVACFSAKALAGKTDKICWWVSWV